MDATDPGEDPSAWFEAVTVRVGRYRIGAGVRIGPGTVIVADDLVIGDGAEIGAGVDLRAGRLVLGANTRIGAGTRMLASDEVNLAQAAVVGAAGDVCCRVLRIGSGTYCGDHFRIGLGASMEPRSFVTIGAWCQIAPEVGINPTEPVTIGDLVGISSRVTVWTHGYHSGHGVEQGCKGRFAGVVVEDGVWLGFDVAVLAGVVVGAGTVVGARAVVQRSLPAGVLAAGIPARVKRTLTGLSLTPQERARLVEELLREWVDRLTFKGWSAAATEDDRWRVTSPGGETWTVSRPAASQIAVESQVGQVSVFDFGAREVTGELDVLGHDLRDLCRRRSWLFPHRLNSSAIVPERFSRLLREPGGAGQTGLPPVR